MKTLYTTEVESIGGRTGVVQSSDGKLKLEVGPPVEMKGDREDRRTNPEQLFGAGYAACFHEALKASAKQNGVSLNEGTRVIAHVNLFQLEDSSFRLGVELRATLPGVDKGQAERTLQAAHEMCPYSKALRGHVDVGVKLD